MAVDPPIIFPNKGSMQKDRCWPSDPLLPHTPPPPLFFFFFLIVWGAWVTARGNRRKGRAHSLHGGCTSTQSKETTTERRQEVAPSFGLYVLRTLTSQEWMYRAHTHTQRHVGIHMRTHTHSHTYTHTRMHILRYSQTRKNTHANTHTHTHTRACTHAYTHTDTLLNTHTHTHVHMHARTSTHS